MIIMPSNVGAAKGPVTLSAQGAYNTTSYSAGDLLLFIGGNNISYQYNIPGPTGTGWTRLTPNPDFTNQNQSWTWKVATSSSEDFTGINTSWAANILVFKNGVSAGGYGVSSLTYTTPAQNFYAPGVTIQKTDGSSYILYSWTQVTPTGVTAITGYNGYNYGYLTNSAISTTNQQYFGQLNQGMVAILEIKNT